MSADNQQGRLENWLGYYIAGFVDGEGSFHVAIQKSDNVKLGYQVIPEFHVSQNKTRGATLELIRKTLGCGYIKPNHARKLNDRSDVLVVRNHNDLMQKVIPFFEEFHIVSTKQKDFKVFSKIVELINRKKHLNKNGLINIIKLAFSMNESGKYRKLSLEDIINSLEPSETVRQN